MPRGPPQCPQQSARLPVSSSKVDSGFANSIRSLDTRHFIPFDSPLNSTHIQVCCCCLLLLERLLSTAMVNFHRSSDRRRILRKKPTEMDDCMLPLPAPPNTSTCAHTELRYPLSPKALPRSHSVRVQPHSLSKVIIESRRHVAWHPSARNLDRCKTTQLVDSVIATNFNQSCFLVRFLKSLRNILRLRLEIFQTAPFLYKIQI